MKKYLLLPVILIIIFPLTGKFLFNLSDSSPGKNKTVNKYSGTNIKLFPSPYLQVETSVYSHPSNPEIIVASAITNYYEYGFTSGFFISTDQGYSWNGTADIKNTSGSTIVTVGDPIVLINNNGNFIMTYVAPSISGGSELKVGTSYSTNSGSSWSPTVYIPGVDTADKLISETDNNPSSPFLGRTYMAYDELKNGGEEIKGVYFAKSIDGGYNWDSARRITDINPLYKYRLISDVAINSIGEVFVLWYTNRNYLGLAKSTNGGSVWSMIKDTAISTDSTIITYEYEDIYLTGVPSLETDKSGGIRNGWMYSINVGKSSDALDIVLHRSTDVGLSWNHTMKVNQDSSVSFRIQSMPALNVDRYGGINVFYYDARSSTANDSFEVYLSRSSDGGNSFFDTKVSDHKFKMGKTLVPLFYFKGYIGSYIGVTSDSNKLTPVWFDNSSGIYQAYTTNIELLPRFEVRVFPEGFYNLKDQNLRMKDTVKVYLRSSLSPYNMLDSAKGIADSVTFNVSLIFNHDRSPGNYYLDIRHRNSIETWSAFPVEYSFGTKVEYDFTVTSASAYGNNEKQVDGKWGIYSGDVDQNGIIDLADVISIYNESINFKTGYIPQDCNGDSLADLSDIIIAYNNSQLFVTKITP